MDTNNLNRDTLKISVKNKDKKGTKNRIGVFQRYQFLNKVSISFVTGSNISIFYEIETPKVPLHKSSSYYLCYLFKIISSSISYVITKNNTLCTTPPMSYHHLHHHVAKGCITLIHHIFSRIEDRNCSFLGMFKRQKKCIAT